MGRVRDLPFTISPHAAIRIQEMLIPPLAILEAFTKPECISPTGRPGRQHYAKGDIVLVVTPHRAFPERMEIVTVMWNGEADRAIRDDLSRVWKRGGWTDY